MALRIAAVPDGLRAIRGKVNPRVEITFGAWAFGKGRAGKDKSEASYNGVHGNTPKLYRVSLTALPNHLQRSGRRST
jgi:hypothetical protein